MTTYPLLKKLLPPSLGMYSLMTLAGGMSLASLLVFGSVLIPLTTSQAQMSPSAGMCKGLQSICEQQTQLQKQSRFMRSASDTVAEPAICSYVRTTCGLSVNTSSSSSISSEASSVSSKSSCMCTMQYSPVCAGGTTFGNDCQARCEGHTTWTPGECAQ